MFQFLIFLGVLWLGLLKLLLKWQSKALFNNVQDIKDWPTLYASKLWAILLTYALVFACIFFILAIFGFFVAVISLFMIHVIHAWNVLLFLGIWPFEFSMHSLFYLNGGNLHVWLFLPPKIPPLSCYSWDWSLWGDNVAMVYAGRNSLNSD